KTPATTFWIADTVKAHIRRGHHFWLNALGLLASRDSCDGSIRSSDCAFIDFTDDLAVEAIDFMLLVAFPQQIIDIDSLTAPFRILFALGFHQLFPVDWFP